MFCKQPIYRISEALLYQRLIFRHKYEFLHNKMTPDIRITVSPRKIGILLDYENSKLSFFNVDISQHLYTFSCQLHLFVHPCFSLEKPGCLKIHNGISMPKHVTFYQTILMPSFLSLFCTYPSPSHSRLSCLNLAFKHHAPSSSFMVHVVYLPDCCGGIHFT